MKHAVAPDVEDLAVERSLAKVAESFRFVLDVTPVNADEQRRAFLRGKTDEPQFAYRDLDDDPAVLATSVAGIDVESVKDPALRSLLGARQRELTLQIDMLAARGTPEFARLSSDLYGAVDAELLREAELILATVPLPAREPQRWLPAAEIAEHAERELAHYRSVEPDIGVHVEVRPDVTGVMVSGDALLVNSAMQVGERRIDPLLQHEVGTHLLTFINGTFQPIQMLASGLAGYEETQEGLAVLAEYLVGGLARFRIRQLAVRVVAVNLMTAGEPFAAVHEAVVAAGFSRHSAFTTAMRVFRCGGLTKDAIYLRGLLRVLGYVRERRDLDLLWIGKLALDHVPCIEDLRERGVLSGPRLRPRYLGLPSTQQRLSRAIELTDVVGLMEEVA